MPAYACRPISETSSGTMSCAKVALTSDLDKSLKQRQCRISVGDPNAMPQQRSRALSLCPQRCIALLPVPASALRLSAGSSNSHCCSTDASKNWQTCRQLRSTHLCCFLTQIRTLHVPHPFGWREPECVAHFPTSADSNNVGQQRCLVSGDLYKQVWTCTFFALHNGTSMEPRKPGSSC
jgi:hypothetical protein